MSTFIDGWNRGQGSLYPGRLGEHVNEEHAAGVIDVSIGDLDILGLFSHQRPITLAVSATTRRSFRGTRTAR